MTTAKQSNNSVTDLCIAVVVSIVCATFSLCVHLTDRLYVLLQNCKNQPLTESLINVIFLLLTLLIWSTYRRWRRTQATIDHLLHKDDLTGLYNRRSFLELARDHLALAQKLNARLWLVFVDLDGLKQINDTFGHREGDRALIKTADALRQTFRGSDIIGRLAGDEFTVLVMNCPADHIRGFIDRLQKNLDACNGNEDRRYRLSVTAGTVGYDGDRACSIDELLALADHSLYKRKGAKRENTEARGTGPRETEGRAVMETEPTLV